MNLWNYIQGNRRGREINYLEKKAMQDSFLADALDGYDMVKSNHINAIESLQKKINRKMQPERQSLYYWVIAATALLLIVIGAYFLFSKIQFNTDFFVTESVKQEPNNSIVESEIVAFPEEEVEIENQETLSSLILISPNEIAHVEIAPISESIVAQTETISSVEITEAPQLDSVIEENSDVVSVETNVPNTPIEVSDDITDLSSLTPQPLGGTKAFENYLKRELIRPQDDECKGKKGRVSLRFYIDNAGRPYNIEIIRSLCPSADREAVRLVTAGPSWSRGGRAAWAHINF